MPLTRARTFADVPANLMRALFMAHIELATHEDVPEGTVHSVSEEYSG